MQVLEYCQQKAAEGGSRFFAPLSWLPRRQRDALTVLGACFLELLDVAADCADAGVAAAAFAWWRGEVDKAENGGTPEHPVMQAWQQVMPPFALPEHFLRGLVDAVAQQSAQGRFADFDDWYRMNSATFGAVARAAARILAGADAAVQAAAEKMALAMALTHRIAYLGADAREGMMLLPVADLQRFQVPAAQILRADSSGAFAELMAFEIERARTLFREAVSQLPRETVRRCKAACIPAAEYYALLQEIERDGAGNVLRYRLDIPPARRRRIAWKTRLLGFRP